MRIHCPTDANQAQRDLKTKLTLKTVGDGLLQEVATNKGEAVVLSEVVEVEWCSDLEEGILSKIARVEVGWLTVDEEGVAMLGDAGWGQGLVDDNRVRIVSNAERLSISNGPVVEVRLGAWGAVERDIRINQEVDILGRLWVVILLASEGEGRSCHGLGSCEVCAEIDLLGAVCNVHLDLWCAECWRLNEIWDDSIGGELVDNELRVCRSDKTALASAAGGVMFVAVWCSKGESAQRKA